MKMFAFFITALAVASADVMLNGPCPKLTPVANFDMAAFQGPWYEIRRLPIFNEDHGDCALSVYTLVQDVLKVNDSHVFNGARKSVFSVLSRADNSNGSGNLTLSTIVAGNVRVTPYWILSTDYENYTIVSSCRDLKKSNLHTIYFWILSRNKYLSPESTVITNNFLKEHAEEFPEDRLIENNVSNKACSSTSQSIYTVSIHQ